MKMANGMGTVYKLSGRRRKPWVAKKTKGWSVDEEGCKVKQLYSTIGYYSTRAEALTALINYNQNPYDIDTANITFAELYDKWSEMHFQTIVPSAVRTIRSAYNHSKPLWNMRMRDIRPNHLEGAINNADVGQSTKQRMKSMYNMMYKYALKLEVVDKDYAQMCDAVKRGKPEIVRIPFSDEEIQMLWDNIDYGFVDMVLIGIYSGWRPQELAILKISDIDLENNTMFGGLKTDAGRNRCVPIHSKIKGLISARMEQAKTLGSEYLFNDPDCYAGMHMTYDKYRVRWNKICKKLGFSHRPHDTRHTFITLAKEAGINEYVIKLIVGHAIEDVTEKVYIHRSMEQLHTEIEKIK